MQTVNRFANCNPIRELGEIPRYSSRTDMPILQTVSPFADFMCPCANCVFATSVDFRKCISYMGHASLQTSLQFANWAYSSQTGIFGMPVRKLGFLTYGEIDSVFSITVCGIGITVCGLTVPIRDRGLSMPAVDCPVFSLDIVMFSSRTDDLFCFPICEPSQFADWSYSPRTVM